LTQIFSFDGNYQLSAVQKFQIVLTFIVHSKSCSICNGWRQNNRVQDACRSVSRDEVIHNRNYSLNRHQPNFCMKIGFTFRTLSVLLCAGLNLPIVALSQDAEKQKIINVITGELDAWYTKDRAKWTGAIVHSNDFILTSASQDGYYRVHGFDSLVVPREQYFSTPADPNVKRISKTDFKVNIKGSIAIVDLTLRGESLFGPFIGDQTILMEKQGRTWKILRQNTVMKTSYELSEVNIESGINTQGLKLLELKKFDDAIKVLTLNTQLFPNAWNTWDSLAEAYMQHGEEHIATGYFKKSIELNPDNSYAKEMIEKMEKNQ
jgi:tetratricopeptide (TPR) repeat protein